MLFAETTFIGIDPTAGVRPFVYAALDHDRKLLVLNQGDIDEVMAFMAGQSQSMVAICAPQKPNQGLMANEEFRQKLTPQPYPGRWMNFRLVDYLLRQHNIRIPQTRSRVEDNPRWMQMGFILYERLENLGFQCYPDEGAERQCMEVYPYACYAAMLDVLPLKKHTLEGRLQRQLALYECYLNVPDPMRIFEEFTRYRLLRGIVPTDNLYSAGELDAIVAAYSAWLAAVHADQVTLIGDPDEGRVLIPVARLKDRY
jgi:hypothetical protein